MMTDKPPGVPECPWCRGWPAGPGHTQQVCVERLWLALWVEKCLRWRLEERLKTLEASLEERKAA